MQKLVRGIHSFQSSVFTSQRALFEKLAKGQKPETLFITCSDSRIDPNLLTQSEPGELFIIRNAGNIVPPWGSIGGEAATIEFAIVGLGVREIIVCGHSHCGAMKGLLSPNLLDEMPAVASWLGHAEATRRIALQKYGDLPADALLNVATQENVLMQLENLSTHPAVAAALVCERIKLHGWVYKLETGEVFAFDTEKRQFLPLAGRPPESVSAPIVMAEAKAL